MSKTGYITLITILLFLLPLGRNGSDLLANSFLSAPENDPPKKTSSKENQATTDKMVLVEAGSFMMGSNLGDIDEKPVHKVKLAGFYIDMYEVTNTEFAAFLNDKGNQSEGGVKWLEIEDEEDCQITYQSGRYRPMANFGNHPVIELSWYGAKSYCKWVNKRLPTEAEWEFAAKGGKKGKTTMFSGSNSAAEVAWFDSNSGGETLPVGTKKPNELGIYDMSGNVWEWCSDWYEMDYYKKSPTANPDGPKNKEYRVLRGGSWVSIENQLRPEIREYARPVNAYYLNGFRCALGKN